jgi:hypothetical protein
MKTNDRNKDSWSGQETHPTPITGRCYRLGAGSRCSSALFDRGLNHVNDIVPNCVKHQVTDRVKLELAHDV